MRGVVFSFVAVLTITPAFVAAPIVSSVRAQGTRCSAFLHQRDGSWRSFADDEMLLPGGPLPIHAGERFSRGMPGPLGLVARILDAQCRLDGPLF